MVKVIVGNNLKRENVVVSGDTTLRSVLENANIDYSRGSMTLDGSTIEAGGLDKTFNEYGIADKCYLLNVVKADNA